MPTSKQASSTPRRRNAIAGFVSETIAEMKKVTWLTRREMVYLTGLVLVATIAAGIVLGIIDLGFTQFIEKLFLGG